MKKGTIFLITILINPLDAKDLRVHGKLYPIQERNLLEMIQERLKLAEQKGFLQVLQKQIKKKVLAGLIKPHPLPQTQTPRSFLFDPTLTVPSDLKDHKGRLIHARGTRINPLQHVSWGKPLLLLDGSDLEQINWAFAQGEAKWVLIAGNPFKLEETLNRSIYFDQEGKIIERFGIQQVPCRISQRGNNLLIEEVSADVPANQHERKK